ncbi:MAG: cytochrome c biogenesis protein CcsA [Verrucomicrobiota bacterium]|nr:cytochrome c biogenesis protein CcsA [Verrucomicrobiota bacterium]
MEDKNYFLIATVLFAISVGLSFILFTGKKPETHRVNYVVMLLAFLFQTAFLVLRGEALGRCPLTNLFEAHVFITWTMAGIYLGMGTAYRLSLLGAFTAPFIVILGVFALVAPIDVTMPIRAAPGFWAELHAPLSVIAYGAFAMAAGTGAMFIAQEYQLKHHHLFSWFQLLPSINELEKIVFRLATGGFVVFSIGLASGLIAASQMGMGSRIFDIKTFWSLLVWALYAILITGHFMGWLRGKRQALLAIINFTFVILTFWGVYLLSEVHQ